MDGSSTATGRAARAIDTSDRNHPPARPRLRGVSHQYAFVLAVVLGVVLVLHAHGLRALFSALTFALSVAAMFGTSALYHRVTWSPRMRPRMRRIDHAMIYCLIAGTYTPFALVVLHGAWRIVVLAVVWSGALAAASLRFVWADAPKWLAAAFGVALGWVGIAAFPKIFHAIGVAGGMLLLGGGLAYTAGAIVYARRRPDPAPTVFGYHEVFHALVIAAVGLQYGVVAFFVLPRAA